MRNVAVVLAIVVDRPRLVPRDLREAQLAEQFVQLRGSRRGEFDELEAVDAHGIVELHRLHAGSGCAVIAASCLLSPDDPRASSQSPCGLAIRQITGRAMG